MLRSFRWWRIWPLTGSSPSRPIQMTLTWGLPSVLMVVRWASGAESIRFLSWSGGRYRYRRRRHPRCTPPYRRVSDQRALPIGRARSPSRLREGAAPAREGGPRVLGDGHGVEAGHVG